MDKPARHPVNRRIPIARYRLEQIRKIPGV
jgi:hypothetical protein